MHCTIKLHNSRISCPCRRSHALGSLSNISQYSFLIIESRIDSSLNAQCYFHESKHMRIQTVQYTYTSNDPTIYLYFLLTGFLFSAVKSELKGKTAGLAVPMSRRDLYKSPTYIIHSINEFLS